MYKNIFKNIIDFVLSLIILIGISPIFILLILLNYWYTSGHPFFLQERTGKNEKPFNIIKFKTMNENRDNEGNLLSDDKRVTSLGKFMRKTSIDELPQIINVLIGEMSLIGPRPFIHDYLDLYSIEQKGRFKVRPGITGWSQVNGRNSLTWTEKFNLDLEYIDNISLMLDIKIILLTLRKLFARKSISKESKIVVERFNGSN